MTAGRDVRSAHATSRARGVWTRVLADVLYDQWGKERAVVETTSLPGSKNGNSPRRGGEPAREEEQE